MYGVTYPVWLSHAVKTWQQDWTPALDGRILSHSWQVLPRFLKDVNNYWKPWALALPAFDTQCAGPLGCAGSQLSCLGLGASPSPLQVFWVHYISSG